MTVYYNKLFSLLCSQMVQSLQGLHLVRKIFHMEIKILIWNWNCWKKYLYRPQIVVLILLWTLYDQIKVFQRKQRMAGASFVCMRQTISQLLATFWTICQGRKTFICFYMLLLRTFIHLVDSPIFLPLNNISTVLFLSFFFKAWIQILTFDVTFLLHIRIDILSFKRKLNSKMIKMI